MMQELKWGHNKRLWGEAIFKVKLSKTDFYRMIAT